MGFGNPNPNYETVTVTGSGDSTGFSTPIGINDTGLIARGVDVEATEFGVRGVATGGEQGPVAGVWGSGGVGVIGQLGLGTPRLPPAPLPSVGVYGVGGPLPSLNSAPYAAGVFGVGGSNAAGVVGQAGAGTADGVQGYSSGTGAGVFGQGSGNGSPGVKGIGHGGPNTIPEGAVGVYGQGGPGSSGVSGQGAVGVSGQGENVGVSGSGTVGGSFDSGSGGPQLHLVPFSVPLEANTYLLNNGQVGDLYLYSQAHEVGTSGTFDYKTILWLCIAPKVPNGQSLWAQIQLGDTVGG